MRDFAKANDIKFYEGEGVSSGYDGKSWWCLVRAYIWSRQPICAYGALGAFGTGVGCTDYLYAMVKEHHG